MPDDWPEFSVLYRPPRGPGAGAGEAPEGAPVDESATTYAIRVVNPRRRAARVVKASVDGLPVEIADGAAGVRLARDGRTHAVEVELG